MGCLLIHHQCAASTWMMRRQPLCARTPTTHQLTGGEETEWWSQSVYGDDSEAMMVRGQWCEFVQDWHPYSLSKDILGFLMTTESQDLGLTSHPKDGNMHRPSTVYMCKQFKTVLNKYVVGFWCERTTGDGPFHWRKRYYQILVS